MLVWLNGRGCNALINNMMNEPPPAPSEGG